MQLQPAKHITPGPRAAAQSCGFRAAPIFPLEDDAILLDQQHRSIVCQWDERHSLLGDVARLAGTAEQLLDLERNEQTPQ